MTPHILMLGICLLPLTAAAQGYDIPSNPQQRDAKQMRLIQNDARGHYRRQSAKCMNAYPENHDDYLQCVQNGRAEVRSNAPTRRYYMPMPAAYRE
jgi:hypothetical protein